MSMFHNDTQWDRALARGAAYPYDAPDNWRAGDPEAPPPPAKDWAHAAARGVLADLSDRHAIGNELEAIDQAVRIEIIESLAAIIRAAGEKK